MRWMVLFVLFLLSVSPVLGQDAIISTNGSPEVTSIEIFVGDILNFLGSITGGTEPYSYSWSFCNDCVPSSSDVQNPGDVQFNDVTTYPNPLTVTFEVTDDDGNTATDTVDVLVNPNRPPEANITYPPDDTGWEIGHSFNFNLDAGDPEGGSLSYSWDFDGQAPSSTVEDPQGIVFNNAGTWYVNVTVTDEGGAQTVANVTINIVEPPDRSVTCYLKTTGECDPAQNETEVLRIFNRSQNYTYFDGTDNVTILVDWTNTHAYPPLTYDSAGENYTPVCCKGNVYVETSGSSGELYAELFPPSTTLRGGAHAGISSTNLYLKTSASETGVVCDARTTFRPVNLGCTSDPSSDNCCEPEGVDVLPKCPCNSTGSNDDTTLDCGIMDGAYTFETDASSDETCADYATGPSWSTGCGNGCTGTNCGVVYHKVPNAPFEEYDACSTVDKACIYSSYIPGALAFGGEHTGKCGVYPDEMCCSMPEDCSNNVNDNPSENIYTDCADPACHVTDFMSLEAKACGVSTNISLGPETENEFYIFYCSKGIDEIDQPLPAYAPDPKDSRHCCKQGEYWNPDLNECREYDPCLRPGVFNYCWYNWSILEQRPDWFYDALLDGNDCILQADSPVQICCPVFQFAEDTTAYLDVVVYTVVN